MGNLLCDDFSRLNFFWEIFKNSIPFALSQYGYDFVLCKCFWIQHHDFPSHNTLFLFIPLVLYWCIQRVCGQIPDVMIWVWFIMRLIIFVLVGSVYGLVSLNFHCHQPRACYHVLLLTSLVSFFFLEK